MAFSEKAKQELERVLAKYPDKRSALLPALYLAQEEYGYLSEEAMREVAELLELEPTEVYSVAGFYTLLYMEPAGRYVLQVCDDLPCALRGAEELVEHLCHKLGIRPGETTPDGLFTLETVPCLAACHRAPVMQVNLEYHEDLSEEKVDELIETLKSDEQAHHPARPRRPGYR
ncbi:MAG: NADH-quinone oxidoreductase subunit NuoE [Anaerolineae bacterium]